MQGVVSLQDFLDLFEFKLSRAEMDSVSNLVSTMNFNYEVLTGLRRDKVIIEVLKRINSNHSRSGEKRKPEWNDGWAENLKEFTSSDFEIDSLIPKYYRPSNIKRWKGDYILTQSLSFEYDFFQVIRMILFQTLFRNAEEVFEFGCGSPHNLAALARVNPLIQLHGCDWSQSAVEMVKLLNTRHGLKIEGHIFDFFNPELSCPVDKNAIFLTCGGLEQVGPESKKFIDFVLAKNPHLVIHLEPIYDLYEDSPTNLLDYLGREYHESRNYLSGYLSNLRESEKAGDLIIENIRRLPIGGQFHEGWSLIIWRPVKR